MPRDQKEFNDYIAKEIRELKQQNLIFQAQMSANTDITQEIAEIIRTGRGFFRVVAAVGRWIRRVIIWLGPVAAAGIAISQFWEHIKMKFFGG